MKIEQVAMLARLNLTEAEKGLFSRQVGGIIDYIDKLNELDTRGIGPTAHVLPLKNIFREDSQSVSLPRESALLNAPDRDNGFYRVPKIIE
ncbi:MAG: Asp-tRNA(Asn)/Glu-tRNA(Gln) amidotransferase subunit GatC [Nitrospiraceae bacterium]|nr:MAG: Asp-tRNA(Asn)/Glu-tRNA(Gln) amidotransferase subunit GatC [Nitrospiraceae bacterium]